jgi:putative ABC transport system permease protein
MRPFATDLRYSLRLLRKSPGFALIAIAALALGIGANTAIFSVIERVLLRPLPFPDSERIVQVRRQYPNGASESISIPKFMAWRKCSAFQSVTLYDPGAVTLNLGRGDRPDPISALHVTSQFFDVFGVKPMVGRTFTAQEDSPHAGNFAVLTFTAWKRIGGDTNIAGRAIELNGEPYVVLGVLPESYQPEPPADLYLPEQFDPNSTNQGHVYLMAGRLRPGVSMEAAKAELNVLGNQFRAEHPDFVDKNETVGIVPLRVAIGGDVRPALLILGGAVSFVLLIACANVANLLLARAASRHRELAVRTAVGASRGRIVRQLLTESMVLALGGGAAGLMLGWAGVQVLLAFSPGNIPRINDPGHAASALSMLDWRVLGFVFGVSVLTGVLFGLFPAIRVSRLDLNSALKEASSRSGTGLRHNRVRGALVIGEIALAMVLLAGAALMIRTFAGLRRVNPGFNTKNVLTIKTAMSGERYASTAKVADMIRQASERIEALPGVEFAGATIALPTDAPQVDLPFSVEGRAPKNGKWEGDEQWRFVSAHYMEALGAPLLRGRFFDQRDTGNSSRVAIVNESFAKKYFPDENAIGKRIQLGKGLGPDFEEPPREIVGVVGNIAEIGLNNGTVPVMYVPQSQITEGLTKLANSLVPLSWAIRTTADPFASLPAISRELIRLDPQLAPSKPRRIKQVIADSTVRESFDTLLLAVFASLALLLAAIGIYGLMSYAVEQRTQEIGIRMALGADSGRMLRFVLRQGLTLAVIGIAAGLAASYGLTRVLAGFLFGVRATDPWTFTGVAAILVVVTLMAAFVPARRATRVDPVIALRQE